MSEAIWNRPSLRQRTSTIDREIAICHRAIDGKHDELARAEASGGDVAELKQDIDALMTRTRLLARLNAMDEW
ncbi:hypothetical protein [Caballeronia sp. LZ035]|uniref:hypothetical protein n=1 Tax=Caballeronia sp. LZ035 TaxID=3038568 RepID=UPI0028577E13|nr:hypothetical protein [Caballeronia sp. LZ035]MDR5763229.1 hypothetical protein [Caballeronia sp. LZ035]